MGLSLPPPSLNTTAAMVCPLDGFPALTAGAAYSVNELLLTSYSGPLFTVRRASDNATQNIGFDSKGHCDEASLIAFCGSAIGYVTTLYDQSGNSRNLTQATAANQPTVYTGTAVQKDGFNVAMLFGGTQTLTRADACGFSGSPSLTAVTLHNFGNSATSVRFLWSIGPFTTANNIDCLLNSNVLDLTTYGSDTYFGTGSTQASYLLAQYVAAAAVTALSVRQNGVAMPYQSGTGGTPVISNTLTVLGGSTLGSFPAGSISTALFLPYTLTTVQQTALEAWLEARRTGTTWTTTFAASAFVTGDKTKLDNLTQGGVHASLCPLDAVNLAPSAAWSVAERLRAAYNGPACNVRRANDNATADIGFVPSTGRLDETALAAFCGTSVGSVTALYDQSGNGRHLTQATAANQPSIYTGTAVQKEGSDVTLLFSSTAVLSRSDSLGLTGNPAFSLLALHNAGRAVPTSNTLCTLGNESAGNGYNLVATTFFSTFNYELGSGNTYTAYGVCTKTLSYVLAQHAASANTDQIVLRANGASSPVAGAAGATATLTNAFSIGNGSSGTTSAGAISTVAVFPSTLTTAQQTALEAWLEARRAGITFAAVAPLAAVLPAVTLSGVIPTLGPLDGLPAAAGAYSVAERLRVGYGGYACNVRRASDNATLDIGFGTDGKLDEAALIAFCGASVGSVTTLYDQSGNGRDFKQVTAASQPVIYDGAVIQKDGGNVSLLFATGQILVRSDALGFVGSPAFTAIALYNFGKSSSGVRLPWGLGPEGGSSNAWPYYDAGSGANLVIATSAAALYGAASLVFGYEVIQHAASATLNQFAVRENAVAKPYVSGSTGALALLNTSSSIGNQIGFSTAAPVGSLSTLVFLPYTLTTAQLAQLEGWLESRRVGTPYAVAVPLPAVDLSASPLAVPYAAAITLDLARRADFSIGTLTGNLALTLTNPLLGRRGQIIIQQDATGGRTLSVSVPSGWTAKHSAAINTFGTNTTVIDYRCSSMNGANICYLNYTIY